MLETTFAPASPGSVVSFMLVVAWVIAAFAAATFYAARCDGGRPAARRAVVRFVAGASVWLGAFAAWVGSGLLAERPVPFVPLTFAAVVAAAVLFAWSPAGDRIARHVPVAALVGFQAFRLPLELVLHEWSVQGTIPVTMTWSGSNLDVVSGVLALLLAPFAHRRAIAWTANLVGVALLANVARVAVMSSPVPFGWPVQPRLMLVAHLPYAFIGPVCVAGAFAGHVMLTRRLLKA